MKDALPTMKTAETRRKILDSAVVLMSEKGYLGATTREIAKTAGVTELTLFRHFGSKERLFEALLGNRTFLPALRELLPDLATMEYADGLETIATRFLQSLRERKPLVKIMQAEMNRNPARMRRIYSQFMDEMLSLLTAYFESRQRSGELRAFPPDVASGMFLGVLFSYFRTEELMRGTNISRGGRMKRAVADFVDIFVHGTAGNGTARRKQA